MHFDGTVRDRKTLGNQAVAHAARDAFQNLEFPRGQRGDIAVFIHVRDVSQRKRQGTCERIADHHFPGQNRLQFTDKLLRREALGEKAVSLQADCGHEFRLTAVGNHHHAAALGARCFNPLQKFQAARPGIEINQGKINAFCVKNREHLLGRAHRHAASEGGHGAHDVRECLAKKRTQIVDKRLRARLKGGF